MRDSEQFAAVRAFNVEKRPFRKILLPPRDRVGSFSRAYEYTRTCARRGLRARARLHATRKIDGGRNFY